ncbi:transmembrane and immunoglobulin domain-containing protein 1 [Salminus brasiliensis]|uniref:transmembrane and immunoglobulin domain-containing protein 1 n=1 Tax=Salminus brasiliensis TaxID=930266 RepID=UPI003B83348D
MKPSVCIHLLLHVLRCACCIHCTNVSIQSNPPANDSIIKTEVDHTVSLSCVVEGSADYGELRWYRNGQLVSLKDENRLEQSHLCVEPVTTDDNRAVFTCQLKTNASVKASIHLEVSFAPDLNGSEEVRFEEQSDAVLSCNVRAYPPVTVIWKKDDDVLDLSSSTYHTSSNGITAWLSISNIKRSSHEGLYSCEATYGVNLPTYEVKSKSFILIVEDKTMKFPVGPTVAGLMVVLLTILLAVISRWQRVMKCFKGSAHHQ